MFPSLNESTERYNQARKSSSKKRRKTDFRMKKRKNEPSLTDSGDFLDSHAIFQLYVTISYQLFFTCM